MSGLIPNRQWNELTKVDAGTLSELLACEVFDGETYLGTWLRAHKGDYPIGDSIRAHAESLGLRVNSVAPPEPRTPERIAPPTTQYPALVKARAVRRANIARRKEKVKV